MKLKYLTCEQEFYHLQICSKAEQLNRSELYEVFETIHLQSMMHKNLFKKLMMHCAEQGVLPPLSDLLEVDNSDLDTPLSEN